MKLVLMALIVITLCKPRPSTVLPTRIVTLARRDNQFATPVGTFTLPTQESSHAITVLLDISAELASRLTSVQQATYAKKASIRSQIQPKESATQDTIVPKARSVRLDVPTRR